MGQACRFRRAGAAGVAFAACLAVWPQAPAPPAQSTASQAPAAAAATVTPPAAQPAAGGKLHGTVKSGNIPLPGVTVTAQNTLTGKRYSTTTDITGAWQLKIPQNGRYVIRTQFAAFAQQVAGSRAERDQPRPDGELRAHPGLAPGRAGSAAGTPGQPAGQRRECNSPACRQRAREPEPDQHARRRHRHRRGRDGRERRGSAIDRQRTPTSATSRWPSTGRRAR